MNKLHLIVRDQFPDFVREDYPLFVAFVEAYYKWMDEESVGKLEDIADLDKTPEQFVEYFRLQLDAYGLFNSAVPFNKLYLQKIKEIYNAKGSEEALVNILRLVHNADTEIKYPSTQILKASDGKWQQDSFITVERVIGTLPNNITDFYVNYDFINVRVIVKKSVNVGVNKVRLYYKSSAAVSMPLEQLISINDNTGALVYSGRVIKSPTYLAVIDGGENWQLGQVIVVPGSVNNTVARVAEVDSNGAVKRVEILEHGYVHTENQLITVSPYPNKPLGSTYSISSELISVDPVAYQHTLDIFDYTDGADERTIGVMSGIGYGSYFLENYANVTYTGDEVFNVSSIAIQPEPGIETDITMEQWLASRATFRYVFDSVTALKGSWADESGQISNQSIRIQDNYYYQQYSYDIEATTNSKEYIDLANNIHPSGMKMFTTYSLVEEFQVIPSAETTFPFVRTDLLDVATIDDVRIKRIIKPRIDTVDTTENIDSKSVDKYLIDSATASSADTSSFSITTYDEEMYFAEDYVRTENTLNIGV